MSFLDFSEAAPHGIPENEDKKMVRQYRIPRDGRLFAYRSVYGTVPEQKYLNRHSSCQKMSAGLSITSTGGERRADHTGEAM